MNVLLLICCIFSEELFIRTLMEDCFRIYFRGCPCHITHNSPKNVVKHLHAKANLTLKTGCSVRTIDFINLPSEKNRVFCIFCDQDYRTIIKHINTRWITLELAVERTLFQYESVKSYFLSENYAQDIFKRLRGLFGDPLSYIHMYVFFYVRTYVKF